MKQKMICALAALLLLGLCACNAAAPQGSAGAATLCVTCADAVASSQLEESLRAVLPQNGAILPVETVSISKGETALGLLQRVLKEKSVAVEQSGGYVKGIGGLSEGACGETSGWLFQVNGAVPSVGAGEYALQDGDAVEWFYICDMNAYFADSTGA